MEQEVNIQHLVSLAGAGDTDAFGQLYDTFLDALYRFVYIRVGNRADAEDITEQTFVSMFTSIGRYVDTGLPFEAWMYRIARNKVIDYYRTKKSHVALEEIAEVPDGKESPEDTTMKNMTLEFVMAGMRNIAPGYQEIIILKFIEDKTNEEISIIIGKPIDQIRVLQHRALAALKNAVHHG